MSFIKSNRFRCYNDYEPPVKKITSEGDILIKNLVDKQQNCKISLEEFLKKDQHFEKVTEQISFMSNYSGTLPLESFKVALAQLEHIEDLKSCDLTNDDVKLILDYTQDNVFNKYRNVNPSVLQKRIDEILQKIHMHKEKSQQKSDTLSKNITHRQNEALAVKPNSIETKLLKFILENEIKSGNKMPDPLDHVKSIEENLLSRLNQEKLTPAKIQKQLRRYANKVSSKVISEEIHNSDLKAYNHSFTTNSKWDQQKVENIITDDNKLNKVYTCKPQNYYTIRNGQIIKLNQNNSSKEVNISSHKLSVEEIKALPQFKNYEAGIPSKTLYVKNLPKQIKEPDLQNIFKEYNIHNSLFFRIMSGKMKGQAFVTFPDIDTALNAQRTINGTLLDEKPIVIEFGKKS